MSCKQIVNTIYAKMKLSQSQIEVLKKVNENIEYGDINQIAEKTGMTRVYVSAVLNVATRTYNDRIIKAAVELISEREQGRKKMIAKLPA